MIDFRYHLVSIVAVFLALGLGILLGSATVGPFLERDIDRRIESLTIQNEERRDQLNDARSFAIGAGPWMTDRRLIGREVVVISFDGSTSDIVDGAITALEDADATVPTVLTLTSDISLGDEGLLLELSDLIGPADSPDELRITLAELLGARLAAASSERAGPPLSGFAHQRLEELLQDLSDLGLVEIDQRVEGPRVPAPSAFVVVGGNDEPADYNVGVFARDLTQTIATRGQTVVASESGGSLWDIARAVREDQEARELVSTVDSVDSTPGQIALVLAL